MKFRYYCLMVMGNVEGVKDEILKISETSPRYLDATGILIATFKCVASPSELEDYFKLNKRSFLLFDMSKESSGYFIDNKRYDSLLFDYIRNSEEDLDELSAKLVEQTRGDSSGHTHTKKIRKKEKQTLDINVEEWTLDEKRNEVDRLLDKGIENLTERDKQLLEILSKPRK